jgi:hypothetical protein
LKHEGRVLAARADDLNEFFCGRRQELASDVGARFAHHGFAPQFVEARISSACWIALEDAALFFTVMSFIGSFAEVIIACLCFRFKAKCHEAITLGFRCDTPMKPTAG